MNLLDKIWFGLLTLTALVTFSCEDPSDIGFDLDPSGLGVDVHYIEFPLSATNILSDSIVTSKSGRAFVGRDTSPEFGTTVATSFGALSFSNSIFTPYDTVANDVEQFGKEIYVFDSAMITITIDKAHIDNEIVGTQIYNVYQLTDSIFPSINYFAHHSTAYDETKSLGTIETTIDHVRARLSADQTSLSVKMDDQIGEAIFDIQTTGEGDLSEQLAGVISGFAIVPDEANNVLFGLTDSTGISVFYHIEDHYYENTDSTTVLTRHYKDSVITLGIESQYYTQFLNDKTGTVTGGSEDYYTSFTSGDFVYLQSATGVYPKVDISPLTDFINSEENVNIQVNRVEFALDIVDNTLSSLYYENIENLRFYYVAGDGAKINPIGTESSAILDDTNNAIINTESKQEEGDAVIIDEASNLYGFTHECAPSLFGVFIEAGTISPQELMVVPFDNATPDFGKFKKEGGMIVRLYYTKPN